MPRFSCVVCNSVHSSSRVDPACPKCGSAVTLESREAPGIEPDSLSSLPPGVWRFRAFLPVLHPGEVVSLGEGGTPLVAAQRLGAELGFEDLMLKDESRNPTGSFMDRGSTVLVSAAKASGVRELTCTTTGNLGASLAAYCARAGLGARVEVHPNTDREKLYQMIAFGAQVEGGPIGRGRGASSAYVTAANPYLLEGEKTTGYEVAQDLGWALPDAIFLPVGTGGHLSMFRRAIQELQSSGLVRAKRCRLFGVTAKTTQPGGGRAFTELESSDPVLMAPAVAAIRESGGLSLEATPEETVRAIGILARSEGIFAEPAAASVVSGLARARAEGAVRKDDQVVCVVTGAGLKDTKAISRAARSIGSLSWGAESPSVGAVGGTKLSILKLASRPTFGYEVWKSLTSEGPMSTASVYQHLGELERLGLIARAGTRVVKGRERVLYQSTKKGLEFIRLAGKVERA